jgi:glycosyltransferase involved in cell wall biosynthesis
MRILHVVGTMNRGGTETWLMQVLREIDREQFPMDFLVYTDEEWSFSEDCRELGSTLLTAPHPGKQPWAFTRAFTRLLQQQGPYDIVHSHVHHSSGLVLHLARQAGVPVRIAHSHSNTATFTAEARAGRRLYRAAMTHMIARNATLGLACSRAAARDLFGAGWQRDARWRLLYCGIDLAPFATPVNARQLRRELGIPRDALVVGHVGRFRLEKNHSFLLEIAAALRRQAPDVHVLLVGDGELRAEVEAGIVRHGLQAHVTLTGVRGDIPRLLLGAMDLFILPSLYEGLPLSLLEAQAAGLPCVVSDAITDEVDVLPSLITRVSLAASPQAWATAVLQARRRRNLLPQAQALRTIQQSPFSIQASTRALTETYLLQQ